MIDLIGEQLYLFEMEKRRSYPAGNRGPRSRSSATGRERSANGSARNPNPTQPPQGMGMGIGDNLRDGAAIAKLDREVFGAVDLGTNNCRLLIAKPIYSQTGQGRTADTRTSEWGRPYYGVAGLPFRVVDAFSRIVRLGEGLSSTGALNDLAIERTITALTICNSRMQRRGVTRARCIATEACRRASNGAGFLDRVRNESGIHLDIITGEQEATLGLIGCLPLLDQDIPNALIFDIGGGSTEITWMGRDRYGDFDLIDTMSIPFGVVTLAESFGAQRAAETPVSSDPQDQRNRDGRSALGALSRGAYQEIVQEVTRHLHQFSLRNGINEAVAGGLVQMVGTSGTVTTLASVQMRLRRYERAVVDGSYMSFSSVYRTIHELQTMGESGREAYAVIGTRRADLVLPGCAILDAICSVWPVGQLRVADRGLREGLLYTLYADAMAAVELAES